MFDIRRNDDGTVELSGRCHAGHTEQMRGVFEQVTDSCEVDFGKLDYIASAGLGVLLAAQKRVKENGGSLILTNLNAHIREVFRIAGFDHVFEIR